MVKNKFKYEFIFFKFINIKNLRIPIIHDA